MQPDKYTASIVKALALVENGGKIPLENPSKGQSGEMKSIFQFTPGTWRMYAKEILGKDDVPLNQGTESVVTYGKVHKWLQEGYSPEEIASIWNSGKPDAYKKEWRGTNKYGVKYDTPGYVEKFKKYLGSSEKSSVSKEPPPMEGPPPIASAPAQAPQMPTSPTTQPKPGLLPNLMSQTRQARQAPAARMPGQKL